MKKFISLLLVLSLCVGLLAFTGCAIQSSSNHSNNKTNDNRTDSESSYYGWVGRFELTKLELNGSTFVKEDIREMGGHADQYVIFNQDGTGRAGLSVSSSDSPLEVMDFTYSYDLVYQSGEMHLRDENGSLDMRFKLSNGVLTFDFYGATMTFKKQ